MAWGGRWPSSLWDSLIELHSARIESHTRVSQHGIFVRQIDYL